MPKIDANFCGTRSARINPYQVPKASLTFPHFIFNRDEAVGRRRPLNPADPTPVHVCWRTQSWRSITHCQSQLQEVMRVLALNDPTHEKNTTDSTLLSEMMQSLYYKHTHPRSPLSAATSVSDVKPSLMTSPGNSRMVYTQYIRFTPKGHVFPNLPMPIISNPTKIKPLIGPSEISGSLLSIISTLHMVNK